MAIGNGTSEHHPGFLEEVRRVVREVFCVHDYAVTRQKMATMMSVLMNIREIDAERLTYVCRRCGKVEVVDRLIRGVYDR